MKDYQKLLPYLQPYLLRLTGALVLLAIAGGLEILLTSLAAPLFDGVLAPAGKGNLVIHEKFAFIYRALGLTPSNLLGRVALALVAITFCKCLCLYISNVWMSYVGQSVTKSLRNALYRHITQQSVSFFSSTATGRLMANVISDVDRLQEAVSVTMGELIRESILLAALVAYVFYIDWKLTLLALIIAPAAMITTLTLGRLIRRAGSRSQEHLAALSDVMQETITGQRIVKAFGMEAVEIRKFLDVTRRLFASNLRAARIMFASSPLMEFLGILCFVPLLAYASHRMVSDGRAEALTLGAFSAFLFALLRLYDPIRKLSRIHVQFQLAFAAAARVFNTLETHCEIKDEPGAGRLLRVSREIVFRDVSFSYADDAPGTRSLKNINLSVAAGQVVALVGSSGAGKSTLVNLLPRFYDITDGSLMMDGMDIRRVTLQSLREQISLVTQETFLFNDSARNNIAYGRPQAPDSEIIEAAQAALAHDFIMQLPQGYDTVIGERGQRLSGGERQRISIARAILKNAPILILDEATSALDSESEALVQSALTNLIRNRTTFVIAHRLSTIRRADMIVVLDDGEIKEVGTHGALIGHDGIYRKHYELQYSEQELQARALS